jgi:hypothetical protein
MIRKTGVKIKGQRFGAFSPMALATKFIYLVAGEFTTMPVGNSVSQVLEKVAKLAFVALTTASRPTLIKIGAIFHLYNKPGTTRYLVLVGKTIFSWMWQGNSWTLFLKHNQTVTVGSNGGIFGNCVIAGGQTGVCVFVDNRQTAADRYNAYSLYLSTPTGAILNVRAAPNSFLPDTDTVLKIVYTRTGSTNKVTVDRITKNNASGATAPEVIRIIDHTNTAAVASSELPATADFTLFKGSTGNVSFGYQTDFFISKDVGITDDERTQNITDLTKYFTYRHFKQI